MKRTTLLKCLLVLMMLSLGASGKDEPVGDKVPKGFSVEYRSWNVGVLPKKVNFIRIQELKGELFVLMSGVETTGLNGATVAKVTQRKELTIEECESISQEIEKAGFFKLKEAYSPKEEEDGGSASSMKVTANGVTKKVSINNTKVPTIDKLVDVLRAFRKK